PAPGRIHHECGGRNHRHAGIHIPVKCSCNYFEKQMVQKSKDIAAADKLAADRLSLYYGDKQALRGITMGIPANTITAFIGPSGCGKSTFLRCFNRMNDLIPNVRIEGKATLDGEDIYRKKLDVYEHRKNIGMVFQKPNPFPKSIYDNVVF